MGIAIANRKYRCDFGALRCDNTAAAPAMRRDNALASKSGESLRGKCAIGPRASEGEICL